MGQSVRIVDRGARTAPPRMLVAMSETTMLYVCPDPECKDLRPYRSQSGLSVHLTARHGVVSSSRWAIQKREVRARKRDPENAPPRRRPGPPPGQPKSYRCSNCRTEIRPDRNTAAQLALPFGDVEFIRKRMVWAVDHLVAKLAIDLAAPEGDIREAVFHVFANRLVPPQLIRMTLKPVEAIGTTGPAPIRWAR